jgi:bifunctional non-homologous end joining protein LigD
MPDLAEYRRKRNFARTPEPQGKPQRRRGFSFVVQKHAARRLHYDFRLELDGVLLSWAVPKGPSLDPADKRLAMQTEDHPIEYGGFEGVIPKGEYGGGTVLLWDRGTWEPIGDPRAGLPKGKLEFLLHGEKLRGSWTLVRIRGRDARDGGKPWLLMKHRDAEVRPAAEYDITEDRPESVASGRAMDEIARDHDRVWHSNRSAAEQEPAPAPKRGRRSPRRPRDLPSVPGARRAPMPTGVDAQLATLVKEPPRGDEWLHELKLDGYRILARVEKGHARLWSRNAKDWTARFPGVARAVEALAVPTAILDGEVAMVLPDGRTSFNALQNEHDNAAAGVLTYFVFDLPYLDGWDLTRAPLEERKKVLENLLAGAPRPLRFSEHVVGSGEKFLREACRLKLEGIVSKRRDAPYTPGRTRTWLKLKCQQEQELVIGGFTEPEGQRSGLGALLLGVFDDGRLRYAGKVGTGFSVKAAEDLRRRLDRLAQPTNPFGAKVPGMARARWVKPELVANVEFSEWTPDGRLRHPAFKGLREDKAPREVVREKPAAAPRGDGSVAIEGVRITHADRVVYPEQGITKRALAEFYVSIAERILPHLVGRPTTLVRCPEGLAGQCFYQKHVGTWAPPSLRRVKIQEKRKVGDYLIVDDLPGLVGLVQIGILEIHTWNSTGEHLEQPDRLVFDLDPAEDVPWAAAIAAARVVRARLEDDGLASFVKTTGGKGLHLVVPIVRGPSWDECLDYSRRVAEELAHEVPEAFVAVMSKARRAGRIYIDYLRNQRGATSVAAYSTRAKPTAPVSTPLTWEELRPDVESTHYTVVNLPRRFASLKRDPWAEFAETRQKLPTKASRRAK